MAMKMAGRRSGVLLIRNRLTTDNTEVGQSKRRWRKAQDVSGDALEGRGNASLAGNELWPGVAPGDRHLATPSPKAKRQNPASL